jgi:WD40 repeat protein
MQRISGISRTLRATCIRSSRTSALRFGADGSRLAVLGSDGSLQVWDLKKLRAALAQFGLDWATPP